MTPEDEVWALDHKRITDLLDQIEAAGHAILTALNCPVDVAVVHDILAGKRRAPWTRGTATRNRQRAEHAMLSLGCVAQTRQSVSGPGASALRAAYWAALAGLYAGDNAVNAVIAHRVTAGGKIGGERRGKQKAAEAAERDVKVGLEKHAKDYSRSEELQFQHGFKPATAYVAKKTGLTPKAARRRLSKPKPAR